MNIRIAQIQDLEQIDLIYNQAIEAGQKTADLSPWESAKRVQWFKDHNSNEHPIYVLEIDSKVQCFASISPYRCGRAALRRTAEISIYINNQFQGIGIGSIVLNFVENDCLRLDINTLFAIIIDTNVNSIKMMEKHGYERWGHMPRIAQFGELEVGHVYYGKRLYE